MSDAPPTYERSHPLPDYEVSQYFPERPEFESEERLREEYGRTRAYFKQRPERYVDVQRWLNQGRFGTTYDIYLADSVRYAWAAALGGLVLGLVVTWALVDAGVLANLHSPFRFDSGIATYVAANRLLFGGFAITAALALAAGTGTYAGRYYYPRFVAGTRRRKIDVVLPHAITYMYAQAYGGMNLVEVIRSTAAADDAYGEVANEFDVVVRDMDLFGNDLLTSLRNARNLTPSDNLEQFVDDLLGVVESGGDLVAFLEGESDEYFERASDEQEDFLETLSIMSEVFIVSFIAAPLFVIVTLMVISFLGGGTIAELAVVIYVGLPLGMLGFLALVTLLSAPYVQPRTDIDLPDGHGPAVSATLEEDERYLEHSRSAEYAQVRAFVANPLRSIEAEPLLSLVVSVPVAIVLVGLLLWEGTVTPTAAGFVARPVANTVGLVAGPVLVALAPLAVFHERKRRRELAIVRRFPDTLNTLSSANYMGIPLTEGLELVARWTSGVLSTELRKVRNDIVWNHDTERALLGFATRLDIPHLTRTMKVVADGGRASGDMHRILSIAADDTRDRYRIERARRRAMSSYLGIVVIGYFVYLLVIVVIDASYLQPIATQAADLPPSSQGLPLSFTNVPVDTYRALFFHSVLIQGFGSGLLAGKLSDNDVLSGLKYSIGLVLAAIVVFTVV